MAVTSCLIKRDESLEINIHITDEYLKLMADWPAFIDLNTTDRVKFDNLMNDFPLYDADYKYSDTTEWLTNLRCKKRKILDDNNGIFVLDNNALILEIFPDSVLMGSFLWGEIFEDSQSEELSKASISELNLLKRNMPPMLCVGKMAMNWVQSYTNAIKLPWFCTFSHNRIKNISVRNNLLVTGGGTGKLNSILFEYAVSLSNHGFKVFIDTKMNLCDKKEGIGLPLFDFSDESFLSLRAIVCRPGIGILTDSVKYAVPTVSLRDESNKEMYHNAEIISNSNLGIAISPNDKGAVGRMVNWLNSNELNECYKNLLTEECNGAEMAAEWLIKKCKRIQ